MIDLTKHTHNWNHQALAPWAGKPHGSRGHTSPQVPRSASPDRLVSVLWASDMPVIGCFFKRQFCSGMIYLPWNLPTLSTELNELWLAAELCDRPRNAALEHPLPWRQAASTAVRPVSNPCHSQSPHFLSVDPPSPDISCKGIVTQSHGVGLAPLTQHTEGHVCGSCSPSHARGKRCVHSPVSGPSDCFLL